MGFAIARAAARRGAAVHLVHGPVSIDPPVGVEVEGVQTALEMEAATRRAAGSTDVVVMAAAVADFRPARPSEQKTKKREVGGEPALALTRNPDILAGLGSARAERGGRAPLLVGFAAETERLLEEARAKLVGKRVDLVVANDVSQPDAGFAVDTNRVVLVDAGGEREVALASKDEVAHAILDRVVEMLAAP
jgi:phosphopantothenoylcysteine decarboxylase/phosphopantothenate--cysteine ligase